MAKQKMTEPIFTRSEVAQILNVSSLTIANREKNQKYPEPKRDLNNYRVYTLNDIFNLQLITYNHINPKPVISVLFDKGYRDTKMLGEMIDNVLSRRSSNVTK
jgi:DNA-binding XRE family transcriptional regulator